MNEPKLSEEIRHKLIDMCVRLKTTEAECNACDVVADRVAALETEAHQVVKALQGDPEPLPDSYYSVAVTVRELRMDLAKSKAEAAEFRAHAWSEQEELRGRLEHAEAERANLLRRIEKLNKRRAADREVVANAEMTLAKLAQVELERDELQKRVSVISGMGGGMAAIMAPEREQDAIELRARRAIDGWLLKHQEDFARLGYTDRGYHVEKNSDVLSFANQARGSRSTSFATMAAIADALLGDSWRET